jgi:hypothetical protein
MSSTESAAPSSTSISRKLRRACRFLLFFCTAGWAFPHVCTEDLDLTRIQNEHMAKKT